MLIFESRPYLAVLIEHVVIDDFEVTAQRVVGNL